MQGFLTTGLLDVSGKMSTGSESVSLQCLHSIPHLSWTSSVFYFYYILPLYALLSFLLLVEAKTDIMSFHNTVGPVDMDTTQHGAQNVADHCRDLSEVVLSGKDKAESRSSLLNVPR